MNLGGRLSLTTLGDVLGTLHREHATGLLELTEDQGPAAGRVHRIVLEMGYVPQIDTPLVVPRLGECLVEMGVVDESLVSEFLTPGFLGRESRIGTRLVDAGAVKPDHLASAVRQQVVARLERMFQIREARIAFRVPRPRIRAWDARPPLGPHDFLYGRTRAGERSGARTGYSAGRIREPGGMTRRQALCRLGVGQNADLGEVRRAFRRLALTEHPDRHPEACAEERLRLHRSFVELSRAYHALVG